MKSIRHVFSYQSCVVINGRLFSSMVSLFSTIQYYSVLFSTILGLHCGSIDIVLYDYSNLRYVNYKTYTEKTSVEITHFYMSTFSLINYMLNS